MTSLIISFVALISRLQTIKTLLMAIRTHFLTSLLKPRSLPHIRGAHAAKKFASNNLVEEWLGTNTELGGEDTDPTCKMYNRCTSIIRNRMKVERQRILKGESVSKPVLLNSQHKDICIEIFNGTSFCIL